MRPDQTYPDMVLLISRWNSLRYNAPLQIHLYFHSAHAIMSHQSIKINVCRSSFSVVEVKVVINLNLELIYWHLAQVLLLQ